MSKGDLIDPLQAYRESTRPGRLRKQRARLRLAAALPVGATGGAAAAGGLLTPWVVLMATGSALIAAAAIWFGTREVSPAPALDVPVRSGDPSAKSDSVATAAPSTASGGEDNGAPEDLVSGRPPPAPDTGGHGPASASRKASAGTPHREGASPTGTSPRRPPTPAAPETDSVLAEVRLMERIRVLMRSGDHPQVLSLLRRHAREFPAGLLREDRAGFYAVALCRTGRAAQGRPAARAFLEEYPSSTHADAVRDACEIE